MLAEAGKWPGRLRMCQPAFVIRWRCRLSRSAGGCEPRFDSQSQHGLRLEFRLYRASYAAITWGVELDYSAYEALFNTGDDAALAERFFASDARMISASGVRDGAVELRAFLDWAHNGLRKVMRPHG